ncbi:MAG: NAD(P)/FAD-dependent oxidoreductase [Clostridiaceae bacterium]|jgi:NAD(P)H-nitrite reductase large subunit|nr:NAD(P)/FAD-dependent oxidoreductase [Clostridiaceae bacterium]
MLEQTILIIGGSAAGLAAAEAARKQDADVPITILSEEPYLPYHRPRLSQVIIDPDSKKNITLRKEEWFKERNIDINLGVSVRRVDSKAQTVELEDGSVLPYGKLILATGSRSFMPPMKGNDLKGVFTIWTLDDALEVSDWLENAKKGVVIGGGLLGLEAAYAMNKRGLETTVLERSDRLLKRQLDEKSSAMFLSQTERLGVRVLTDASTEEIIADENGKVARIRLEDGREVECDVVVVSTGVRARVEVMENEPISIDRRFVVNNRLETDIPNVYAAGDCAVMEGVWFGLWPVSVKEGKAAGTNAAGGDEICVIPTPPYLVNTMETRVASAGIIESEDESIISQIQVDDAQLNYDRRNFKGDALVGYVLLGDTTPFSMLARELQYYEG